MTSSPSHGYAMGYETLNQELTVESLPVEGRFPEWLDGALLRTGPAQFEVGHREYRHWFDGLAMLHRFGFRRGAVSYRNRFLRSPNYREAQRTGRICRSEFATDPCHLLFRRLRSIFFPGLSPDGTRNGNVNVARIADAWVAMTETPLPVEFDPETLNTVGNFDYTDGLPGQISTAHPHGDRDGKAYNHLVHLARKSAYLVFRTGKDRRRELVARLPTKEPAYLHSFGITERFVVLAENPLVVNPLSFVFRNRPFIENYRWKGERGSRFFVVSKDDGRIAAECAADALFVFHHVNAFERDGEVVVDLIAYPDNSIIDVLYLDHLRAEAHDVFGAGQLRRYRLPLGAGEATWEPLVPEELELPRIHYGPCNGRAYRYVYGVGTRQPGTFPDGVIKGDVERGESALWREERCFPGEPVFVASPVAKTEDDGVLLSVVLDAGAGKSFLLVLDAATMTERARAKVPHRIPFMLHGQYASAT